MYFNNLQMYYYKIFWWLLFIQKVTAHKLTTSVETVTAHKKQRTSQCIAVTPEGGQDVLLAEDLFLL